MKMGIKQTLMNWMGKKKEKLEYPYEFAEVVFNDSALNNGIGDYSNKLILRYKYNSRIGRLEVYRVYGYSDSLVKIFREKLKIPVYDTTTEETQYPIYG